mgnify:CR=1 FL=1
MQQQPFIPENYDQSPQIDRGKENILYIFTPRKWGMQARRPLLYNFSAGNFKDDAQRAVLEASTSFGSARGNIERLLANSASQFSAMPASDGQNTFNLDYLSDNYTFVLVTHQRRNQMQNASFTFPGSHMTIHYGYFIDEPVNMALNTTNPTPNPNAKLVITHRTSVTESKSYGQQGPERLLKTNDHDVIDPGTMNALSTDNLYFMAPEVLHSSVGPISQDNTFFDTIDLESKIDPNSMRNIESASWMQLPHENVKHILSAAAQTQDAVVSSRELGMMPHDDLLLRGNYQDLMASNLSGGTTPTSAISGMDTNDVHTLQQIINMYNPIIQPNIIPKTQYFETLDQTVKSPGTIYNSFLTTCVPVYLAKGSLSSLSFSYDSVNGDRMIHNAEPMVPMSNDELRKKVKATLTMIEENVLKIIKNQRDNFQMVGNFACGGVSHSQIHFYCDNNQEHAYFEMPGIFGGINSMLVGNKDVAQHNGFELAALVGQFDDSESPMVHDTRTMNNPEMSATYDHGYTHQTSTQPPDYLSDNPQMTAPSTYDYLGDVKTGKDENPSFPNDTLTPSFSRRS